MEKPYRTIMEISLTYNWIHIFYEVILKSAQFFVDFFHTLEDEDFFNSWKKWD